MDRGARLGQPRRRPLPAAVALALLLPLIAGPIEAAEKVDLSPYLGIVPEVMDSRSYENPSGSSRTEQGLSVAEVDGGWEILTRVGASERRELVLPGDRVLVDYIGAVRLSELQTWAPLVRRVATEFGDTLTGVPDEWLVSTQINGIVLPLPEAP